jgi:hypothetical protein
MAHHGDRILEQGFRDLWSGRLMVLVVFVVVFVAVLWSESPHPAGTTQGLIGAPIR